MKERRDVSPGAAFHVLAWCLVAGVGIMLFMDRRELAELKEKRKARATEVISSFQAPMVSARMLLSLTNELEARGIAVAKCESTGGGVMPLVADPDVLCSAAIETAAEPKEVAALLPEV